ncbi:17577_t:CDS:1, partial [Gigaspora margarita]
DAPISPLHCDIYNQLISTSYISRQEMAPTFILPDIISGSQKSFRLRKSFWNIQEISFWL